MSFGISIRVSVKSMGHEYIRGREAFAFFNVTYRFGVDIVRAYNGERSKNRQLRMRLEVDAKSSGVAVAGVEISSS